MKADTLGAGHLLCGAVRTVDRRAEGGDFGLILAQVRLDERDLAGHRRQSLHPCVLGGIPNACYVGWGWSLRRDRRLSCQGKRCQRTWLDRLRIIQVVDLLGVLDD